MVCREEEDFLVSFVLVLYVFIVIIFPVQVFVWYATQVAPCANFEKHSKTHVER